MACSMNGEEKLARDLASRGVSRFTDVSGVPSNLLCVILLAAASLFLFLHAGAFSKIYAVQLARFSGNYAETEATVVSHSGETEYVRHLSSDFGDHKGSGDVVQVSEVTIYHIKAVGDDGAEFSFNNSNNYGRKGDRLRIKYSKSNPRNCYVVTDFSHMPTDRRIGLAALVFAVLAFAGAYAAFRRNRKKLTDMTAGPYLPVLATSHCEVRTAHARRNDRSSPRSSHKEYAPVFRYAMPDGAELLFQGRWSRKWPDGEAANEDKEFRVYMMDPEDRSNNQYFIQEIRR